jgi:GAF domain-containing protein
MPISNTLAHHTTNQQRVMILETFAYQLMAAIDQVLRDFDKSHFC